MGVALALLAAVATAAERPGARTAVVPERTILLLQQELAGLTAQSPDAVVYGGSRDMELLRQIAAATRASAQAQIELLRQQNEIIRLLEELGRRGPAR
jgi:hypothetical protein